VSQPVPPAALPALDLLGRLLAPRPGPSPVTRVKGAAVAAVALLAVFSTFLVGSGFALAVLVMGIPT
jgi:hypothetical protein